MLQSRSLFCPTVWKHKSKISAHIHQRYSLKPLCICFGHDLVNVNGFTSSTDAFSVWRALALVRQVCIGLNRLYLRDGNHLFLHVWFLELCGLLASWIVLGWWGVNKVNVHWKQPSRTERDVRVQIQLHLGFKISISNAFIYTLQQYPD